MENSEFPRSGRRRSVSFADDEERKSPVETHLRQMKIESELLSRKAELMEKNMLLYRSYELLSKIEADYLQDGEASDWNNTSQTDDVLSVEFEKFALEQKMKLIQNENKELRKLLNEESTKSKKLKEEMQSQGKEKHTSLDTMSQNLQALISSLEQENTSLKAELKFLRENSENHSDDPEMEERIQKLKDTLVEKFKDLEMKDDMIRVRNLQIQQYEAYVKKLHFEIKKWLGHENLDSMEHEGSGAEQGSIIPVLESQEEKLQKHTQLVSQVERLQLELDNARRKERELKNENRILEGTIQSLNSNIEGIFKTYQTKSEVLSSPSPSTEIGRFEDVDKVGLLESEVNDKYAHGDFENNAEHFSGQKFKDPIYSSGSDEHGDI